VKLFSNPIQPQNSHDAVPLKRHQRSHNQDRPFTCPTCRRSFAVSHHLRSHQRSHHHRHSKSGDRREKYKESRELEFLNILWGLGTERNRIIVPARQKPKNGFQGINAVSLCWMAGRHDNPSPTRFLARIACLKNLALIRGYFI
jgi:hypothetical protein